MNDFNVHFSKTTSVKKLCSKVHRNWTRGAYFKTEGEEKLLKHMAMEMMFGDFYIAERIFGAILSLETDLVFMVTCFSCEPLGENGREYR